MKAPSLFIIFSIVFLLGLGGSPESSVRLSPIDEFFNVTHSFDCVNTKCLQQSLVKGVCSPEYLEYYAKIEALLVKEEQYGSEAVWQAAKTFLYKFDKESCSLSEGGKVLSLIPYNSLQKLLAEYEKRRNYFEKSVFSCEKGRYFDWDEGICKDREVLNARTMCSAASLRKFLIARAEGKQLGSYAEEPCYMVDLAVIPSGLAKEMEIQSGPKLFEFRKVFGGYSAFNDSTRSAQNRSFFRK